MGTPQIVARRLAAVTMPVRARRSPMDPARIPIVVQDLGPRLARYLEQQLSARLRARIDPEDVVQAVFASIFLNSRNAAILAWPEGAVRGAAWHHADCHLRKSIRYHR